MPEDTAPAPTASRTPWHLWVVGILVLLWDMVGAYDYLMTQTQNESYMSQFTPEQLEFFYGFPAWVVAFWAIAVWSGVLGSVLLLLRKRLAVPVFAVALVAMLVTTFHNFVLSYAVEVMDTFALVFTIIIFLISLGLLSYAAALKKRGVLA